MSNVHNTVLQHDPVLHWAIVYLICLILNIKEPFLLLLLEWFVFRIIGPTCMVLLNHSSLHTYTISSLIYTSSVDNISQECMVFVVKINVKDVGK